MNKITYLKTSLFFCLSLLFLSGAGAQNSWDIRLAQSSLFCESNRVCYNLQLRSGNANDWYLGDQNYRFLFDGDLMTVSSITSLLDPSVYGNAVIDQNLKFSGMGQDAASPLDDIDDNLGFLDFIITQIDKSNPSNAALIQTADYISVAEICIDLASTVITNGECLSFYHSRPATAGNITNQYTTITENDAPGSSVLTVANIYGDLTPSDGAPDACSTGWCTSDSDDFFDNVCPGEGFFGDVSTNDTTLQNGQYRVIESPQNGFVMMFSNGGFNYTPNNNFCGTDQFKYSLCAADLSFCDTATVYLDSVGCNIQPPVIAGDDSFTLCPGINFTGNVLANDRVSLADAVYDIVQSPSRGILNFSSNGEFNYTPPIFICGTEQFTYELCDTIAMCCDTATVLLNFNDTTAPVILTIPNDTVFSCEQLITDPPMVFSMDNCNFISVEYDEISDQESSGCKRYSYQIERTWTFSDYCNKFAYVNQTITVIDTTPPNFTVPTDILIGCLDDIEDLGITGDVFDESDNCSVDLEATYSDAVSVGDCDAGYSVYRTWTLTDDCNNQTQKVQTITVRSENIAFNLKVMLQGALIDTDGTLMRDDLRKTELIPTTEPYSQIGGFQHVGGGGETLDENLLQINGNNAIVDWLFLEIRHPFVIDSIIATRSVLLQRDGDVINPNGGSLLVFSGLPSGIYHIAVRHRNHLGIMTKLPVSFSDDAIPVIDFSALQADVWGTNAQAQETNYAALWSGDLNQDQNSIYQGPDNDPTSILLAILLDSDNTLSNANYIKKAYHPADLDLSGDVIFQGPNNDKAKLLFYSILKHPGNLNFLANFINQEQLPKSN